MLGIILYDKVSRKKRHEGAFSAHVSGESQRSCQNAWIREYCMRKKPGFLD